MNATTTAEGSTPRGLPDSGPLLRVEDLRTTFPTPRGRVTAVDGVSFELQRGRTLGIVGESGSGKSVLSRSIMGLLPKSAERSGRVHFEGRDITDLDAAGHRALWGTEIAMVFQDPMTALNPVMKIGRQITESLRYHLDMDKAEARETAVALLRAVKIPEADRRFDAYPHEMSGGMRQRVVIAVALACGPKLLLADEPTTALDVTVQAQILDLLAEQQRERYMAMILVTHDLGVVAGRADQIAVMYAGRVVEYADTAVLFRELRMPYTEALLNAIPKLSDPSHTRLAAIGGRPPDLIDPPKGCPFSPRCPYVRDRCREERPELTPSPTDPTHLYACFYPVGSPETEEIRVQLQAQRLIASAPPEVRAAAADHDAGLPDAATAPTDAQQRIDDRVALDGTTGLDGPATPDPQAPDADGGA